MFQSLTSSKSCDHKTRQNDKTYQISNTLRRVISRYKVPKVLPAIMK